MPKKAVFPKIPERETIYATLIPNRESVFYITADPGRVEYRLYQRTEKGVTLTGRAKSPDILEGKYIKWGPERDLTDGSCNNDMSVTPFEMQEYENKRLSIEGPPVETVEKKQKGDY